MKNRAFIGLLVLLAASPLLAQVPKGWMVRVDRSASASDPDAAGSIKLVATGSGFRATAPQAATFWNPANTATGNYTLKATFTLLKSTGYLEYYGLVFGGSNLEGAAQDYLYFIITDDGTWMVKRRTGSATQNVTAKTSSDAVKKPDASGKCTNALEVRVTNDKIGLLVNGTVVGTIPKSGQAAKTDGIAGFRVNHHLDVQIDGFSITKE